MIKTLLIIFGLAGVFLVGEWTQKLRQQVAKLQEKEEKEEKLKEKLAAQRDEQPPSSSPAAPKGDIFKLQAELNFEKQKLEDLRKNLADQRHPEGADAHIAQDQADLAKLKAKLAGLGEDGKVVQQRSREYRNSQNQRLDRDKEDVRRQLESNALLIHDLQDQIQLATQDHTDPNRKSRLQQLKEEVGGARANRRQLDAQKRDLEQKMKHTTQAIADEVKVEQAEVASDRDQVVRDLEPLQQDLARWQKIKAGDAGRDQALEQLIKQQITKVKTLESAIEVLKR